MTAMISGCGVGAFSAAIFLCLVPVGGCQTGRIAGFHGGETGEDVFEVFPCVDAEAAAVLDYATVSNIGVNNFSKRCLGTPQVAAGEAPMSKYVRGMQRCRSYEVA